MKMSIGLKDSLTVSVKPYQIQFDTMNNNAFLTVLYGDGDLPLSRNFDRKLAIFRSFSVTNRNSISEIKNISQNFFNKLKNEKSIDRYQVYFVNGPRYVMLNMFPEYGKYRDKN